MRKHCGNCANYREETNVLSKACEMCVLVALGNGDPSHWREKLHTNADRIRAMSDKELRNLLCTQSDCALCKWDKPQGCTLNEWLKQPAEVD